jgi:very-short-patch-repair endonuclease
VYCEECRRLDEEEHEALKAENAVIRKKIMFDTAIQKMEFGHVYMHEYCDIAKNLKSRILADTVDFRSADELIAAMVLESYNVQYEANKKIDGNVVDFYIPSMYVCLEIDGDRHKWSMEHDSKRDIKLRNYLGPEWEIIHIPTDSLEKNPERLVDAIEALYKEKKKLRYQNHGILPESFSRREMQYYAKLVPTRKEYIGR